MLGTTVALTYLQSRTLGKSISGGKVAYAAHSKGSSRYSPPRFTSYLSEMPSIIAVAIL